MAARAWRAIAHRQAADAGDNLGKFVRLDAPGAFQSRSIVLDYSACSGNISARNMGSSIAEKQTAEHGEGSATRRRTMIGVRLRDHGAPDGTTGFWRVLMWRPSTALVKRPHLVGRIRQFNGAADSLEQRHIVNLRNLGHEGDASQPKLELQPQLNAGEQSLAQPALFTALLTLL